MCGLGHTFKVHSFNNPTILQTLCKCWWYKNPGSYLWEAHIPMVEADVQGVIRNPKPREGFKVGRDFWLNTAVWIQNIHLRPSRNRKTEILEKIKTNKIKKVGQNLTAKERGPQNVKWKAFGKEVTNLVLCSFSQVPIVGETTPK